MSEQTKPTTRLRSMLTMGGSGVITADEQSAVKELVSAFDAQALEIEKLQSELQAAKDKLAWKSMGAEVLPDQTNIEGLVAERDRLQAELDAVRDKYEELTSYMPKIPTEPYEKRLARECRTLQSRVEKLKAELEQLKAEKQK